MKNIFIIIGFLLLAIAVYFYVLLFGSNTGDFTDKTFLFIPTGSTYADLLKNVEENHVVKNIHSFDKMATRIGLSRSVHPGKYQIKQGMGNFTIVQMLKGGKQIPVKLVINKLRTKDDIVRKICHSLEADSNELRMLFKDSSFLSTYGIDSNQIQVIVMPDTYQFYWNTNSKKAMEKIAKNYLKFWTKDRKDKAMKLNLSLPQIITLSSIVEEETNMEDDKPIIASTYLNRLRKGMPLQADPTLKYAVGNFMLKRLTEVQMRSSSPYNTYRNKGLPPGPICTPAITTIDATLDAPTTDYLYFCAREDLNGYSNFSTTYAEHLINAKKYQQALNKRGIR